VYAHLAPPMRGIERENPTTAERRMRTRPGNTAHRTRQEPRPHDETAV